MSENTQIRTCSCEAYKLMLAEKDAEIERLRNALERVAGILDVTDYTAIRAAIYNARDVLDEAEGGEQPRC